VQSELRALVFDLDGTLYVNADLGRQINLAACRYVAELRGIDVSEAEALIRETRRGLSAESGTDTPLSRVCMKLGADLRELHRRFANEVTPERFLSRDERVANLLKALGTKFELFIYTNNNRSISSRVMGLIGVAGLFRQVLTIEDFWEPKPDQAALEHLFRAIGRKPAECLFVGDRYDVDLRLPAAMGSAIFLATNAEELFPLGKLLNEENL
jgi:putative hydrolase of the HAD superfamily